MNGDNENMLVVVIMIMMNCSIVWLQKQSPGGVL